MAVQAEPAARRPFPWGYTVLACAIVAAIVIAISFFTGRAAAPSGHLDPAYVSQVRAYSNRVLEADTMMAGSVIYVDGTVANLGRSQVTAIKVELRFRDPYGQLVQQEQAYVVGSATGPLAAGARRSFRLGFDHVSAQWNQAPPTVHIVSVYTR